MTVKEQTPTSQKHVTRDPHAAVGAQQAAVVIPYRLRKELQNPRIADPGLKAVAGPQGSGHRAPGLAKVLKQHAARARLPVPRDGPGDRRGEIVGRVVQAHGGRVPLAEGSRILRVEEVLVELRIDRVAQALRIEVRDGGIQLNGHFV